jgi:hypothetical protein
MLSWNREDSQLEKENERDMIKHSFAVYFNL